MVVDCPGYTCKETLFSSSSCRVVRAIRASDGLPVIVKQFMSESPSVGQLSRFSFSFDILEKFDHPNIVKAIAWDANDRNPVIVFEDTGSVDILTYTEGFERHQLPLKLFLRVALQVADALSVIHYHQVIHKDLHPGNILINPETGKVHITDFGIASLLSREQPILATPDKIEGVLAYVSPEQTGRMNRALDYRSDFYSLGATFYRLLVGTPPFVADDDLGVIHAHIAKQQTPVAAIRRDIPESLSNIIDKLLFKAPEERYQSALGLKNDLQRCADLLEKLGEIPLFKLAEHDVSDHFQVSQVLYGRDKEIAIILDQFRMASEGKPQMLAVAGYSGIGKSALVREVHKPIAAQNGLFVAGKFDQYQRNIPYSAVKTAVKAWLKYALSLDERQLSILKSRLLETLGSNVRLLCDFLSEFSLLFPEMPKALKLGADETKNRFHWVFRRFIKTISEERPLVIFLDDIQWADRGTLDLLPQLMVGNSGRLFLVTAYRDNEVDENHPVSRVLNNIEQVNFDQARFRRISLGPLDVDDIARLLCSALHRPPSELQAFAELILKKTAGNPFFIGEFLKHLYTEKLLNFDLEKQCWCWRLDSINSLTVTDSVAGLLMQKMSKLERETLALMQYAACMGSRFELGLLSIVSDKSLPDIVHLLWPALNDGLIIQNGGDWSLGALKQSVNARGYLVPEVSENNVDNARAKKIVDSGEAKSFYCRFVHDQVLHAAYKLMPKAQRQNMHLLIGRLMMSREVDGGAELFSFDVVEQLNQALPLITDSAERLLIAQRNQWAAQRSRAAAVWQAVAEYSTVGIQLLPDNAWDTHAELTQSLYTLKAEAEYLCGRPETSDDFYNVLFERITSNNVKADLYATRFVQAMGRGKWRDGVGYGLEGLALLNYSAPDEAVLSQALDSEQALLANHLDKTSLNLLSELGHVRDKKVLILSRILSNLAPAFQMLSKPELSDYFVLKSVNLLFDHGVSDLTAQQLILYSRFLSHHEAYQQAVEVAQQALSIAESNNECREISNFYNVLVLYVLPLFKPIEACTQYHEKGIAAGLENGEIARAVMNRGNMFCGLYSQGADLDYIQKGSLQAKIDSEKAQVFYPLPQLVHELCRTLTVTENKPDNLFKDAAIDQIETIRHSAHFNLLLFYREQASFWRDMSSETLLWGKQCHDALMASVQPFFCIDHYVVYGLALIRNVDTLNSEQHQDLDGCLSKLEKLAAFYPNNFAHKYLLLCAAQASVKASPVEVVYPIFKQAIQSAKENGFQQYQALGNEWLYQYFLEKGMEDVADYYAREALYLYNKWGCLVKVERLSAQVSNVPSSKIVTANQSTSLGQAISDSSDQSLDLASVMKSAQVISSELQFTKLASKVLEVIVECAGATSAAFITQNNGQSLLEVYIGEEGETLLPDKPIPLSDFKELPLDLIHFVLRSKETVSLSDAVGDNAFLNDPYMISRQPKSILGLPVEYREQVIGVLYLENNLTRNAFTKERLDVVRLLVAQAAISFENARLFDEVKYLNQGLEEKIVERTKELEKTNKHLEHVIYDLKQANNELDAYTRSVSHDLRAPVRKIKSFSDILKDEFSAELGEEGNDIVNRILNSSVKMAELIEGLLALSRVQKQSLKLQEVDLSDLVQKVFSEMDERFPGSQVQTSCALNFTVVGDRRLLYSLMENLMSNAWKYTTNTECPKVEFGVHLVDGNKQFEGVGEVPDALPIGTRLYFVRDNGAGFDMGRADELFSAFQRYHNEKEYEGVGIGLSTVQRIVHKHGGIIWADAQVNKGATFYFTLPESWV